VSSAGWLPAIIPTYQKQGSEDFEDEYFYQYTLIDFAIRFFKPSPLVCLLLFLDLLLVSTDLSYPERSSFSPKAKSAVLRLIRMF